MRFSHIPGYNEVKSKLIAMHKSNRIGHAVTFVGERGSANLSISIAFAQYIACESPSENDSCGNCPSCKKFEKNTHPDVHFYFPTTTSSEVPKNALSFKYYEKWREYLKTNLFPTHTTWLREMDPSKKDAIISTDESAQIIKDLALKSYESENRFSIIWLPEKMNVFSSNKLLKIIEEPPPHVYFFLVTENQELVLPTITSRTQTVRLGKLSNDESISWIKSMDESLSEQEVNSLVKNSGGNPLKISESLKNRSFSNEIGTKFLEWARLCYKAYEKMPELIEFSENLSTMQREEQNSILNYGIDFFRSGLMVNNSANELILAGTDDEKHIRNFAPLLNIKNSSKLISSFERSLYHLERYANTKILFLDLSIEFSKNINAKNVPL